MQANEIQSRFAVHDAALVLRLSVPVEDREIDPREPWMKPSAPDDVRHVKNAAVLEKRQTVPRADYTGRSLNACSSQVFRFDSDERSAAVQHPGPNPPADWSRDGENAVKHHAQHEADKYQPRR